MKVYSLFDDGIDGYEAGFIVYLNIRWGWWKHWKCKDSVTKPWKCMLQIDGYEAWGNMRVICGPKSFRVYINNVLSV